MNLRPSFLPALAALTLTLSSALPAWSADYNLKKTALTAGHKVDTESTMTMDDAQLSFSVQGQTIKGTMSMIQHKMLQIRVTTVKDGQPVETETETKESTQKQKMTINGNPKENEKTEPLQGLTMVSKLVDAKWKNQLKTGEPTPEQQKALDKVGGFESNEMYEDKPVAVGASWTVAPENINKMLGESSTTNTTGTMQCKFDRVEKLDGRPCAVVAVALKVSGTPEGQPGTTLTMELKGNIYRALEEKVDVKIDLNGTMKMEGAVPGAPPGSTMEASGPLTMKQTSAVSK